MKLRTGCFILSIILVLSSFTACQKSAITVTELVSLGENYLIDMDYEQAIVQFLQVIELEPMLPRGYTGAAEAYVGLDRSDDAKAILEQGERILPGNLEIRDMQEKLFPPTPEPTSKPTQEPTSDAEPKPTPSPSPIPTPSEIPGIDSDEITIVTTLIDNNVEYAEQYKQHEAEKGDMLILGYGFRFEPPLKGIDGIPVYEAAAGDSDLKWYENLPDEFNGLEVSISGKLSFIEDYHEVPDLVGWHDGMYYIGAYLPNGPYEFFVEQFEIVDPNFVDESAES